LQTRDPDPFKIFKFSFRLPGDGDDSSTIDIEIRGCKTDADEVWKSTGLTLWRASDYLCQYQLENVSLFLDKRVLELGAGLGLNGILAWRSTVKNHSSDDESNSTCVYITDGDSDALKELRENIERNRPSDDAEGSRLGKASCHQLIWGKDSSQKFLERTADGRRFDVLLASDIIYSPVIVDPLFETLDVLLKKPSDEGDGGGVFVMAYARREVPISIEMVLQKATECGFVYELVKSDEVDGIWVYTFRHRL